MFTKTDAELTTQVQEELRWDCCTENSAIHVEANQGVVTLSGRARHYLIKRTADEAAKRVAGVRSVNNEIEVKIPYADFRSDMEIGLAARQAFVWNTVIPENQVQALVTEGWVTLSGKVHCWSERDEVERVVSHLLAVRGVTNVIAVDALVVESDEVCEAITAALERHWPTRSQQVTVEMESGVVRLSGNVSTWGERFTVTRAVGFAPGVRDVVTDW